MLRHLAKSWRVHLGCFVDDPADWRYMEDLRPYCADLCCVGLDRRLAKLRSLGALLTGTSLSEAYFHSPRLQRWASGVLRDIRPPSAYLFSSVMGQYVPAGGPLRPSRVIMDFVDVDSDKWRQYAGRHSWPMSWIYRRESSRLLASDRALSQRVDAGIFVSEPEAALFRRLSPETAATTLTIANGIDIDYFSPDPLPATPFPAGMRPLVFTGAMDYWPNIDAARWFAETLFPEIRRRLPDTAFHIVGSNPTPEVRKLAALPGVFVTGRVPDIRPYIAHAAVSVAPMRVARGVQNKILEGMALGRVVVTTDLGLEGIEAVPGRDLLVANDARAFTEIVLGVLTDPSLAAIGQAARRRILEGYRWDDKLAVFERLLREGLEPV